MQLQNIGTVPANSSIPKSVYFDSSNCPLTYSIPIGKIFFQAGLYSDNDCNNLVGTQTAPVAVFVNDGINAVTVNLPTINYTN